MSKRLQIEPIFIAKRVPGLHSKTGAINHDQIGYLMKLTELAYLQKRNTDHYSK